MLIYLKMLRSSFVRNTGVLVVGTVLAQAMSVLIIPVLTRYYTPDAFGVFGTMSSIFSVIVVVSALRYQLAIVLPDNDCEAVNLYVLSNICVLFVSITTFCILIFYSLEIFEIPHNVIEAKAYLLFIPPIVFFSGLLLTGNYWLTYREAFKELSILKVVRSLFKNIFQVVGGFCSSGPKGLLLGFMAGTIAGLAFLISTLFKGKWDYFIKQVNFDDIKKNAKKYSHFPKYGAPQGAFSAISFNIPVLIISYFFGAEAAGHYFLAIRVLKVPVDFISQSLRQVIFKKLSSEYNKDGEIYHTLIKSTLILFLICGFPVLTVVFWGEEIFGLILGTDWKQSGLYAQYLVIWVSLLFINPPVVMACQVLRLQRFFLGYEIFALSGKMLMLFVGGAFYDIETTILLYVLVNVIGYIYLILYVLKCSKRA
ncbi:MAG: oligosaccharide flippase family protein [Desulfobacteraceae bacterium]|nr:oligosaccharide flippase family protein [Desulfobacteraceae bacterium]